MGKKARELGNSPEELDNDKKKEPRQFDSPIKKTPTDEELEEALENSGGVQEAASVWLRKNKGIIYARSSISGRRARRMLPAALFSPRLAVKSQLLCAMAAQTPNPTASCATSLPRRKPTICRMTIFSAPSRRRAVNCPT